MKKRILGLVLLLIMQLNTAVFAKPQMLFVEQIETINNASIICANDKFAFVKTLNTVQIYNVSGADSIEHYGQIKVNPNNMEVDENRLYIGLTSGCGFINLSDIKEGAELSASNMTNFTTTGNCTVSVKDNYVFISDKNGSKVSVRNMNLPRYRQVASLGSDYVGMRIKKNKAYIEISGSYHIYDLTAYAGETSIESFKIGTVPIPDDVTCIDFKDNYVFMGNAMYPSVDNRVWAYRINANGTSTKLWGYEMLGAYGTRISDLVVKGNFLYVASQDKRGIYLLNIENPENGADWFADVDNYSRNYDGHKLALCGDKIIATDTDAGVAVFKIADMAGRADNFNLKIYPMRKTEPITTVLNTSVKVSLEADNYLAEEVSGKLILASYSGEKLIEIKSTDVTLAPCTMKQVYDVGTISSKAENGFKVRAMFWKDNTPIIENITIEYPDEEIRNEFYVDVVNGSDKNDGTEEAPFATIEKARDTLRGISRNMRKDITVYIKDGIYNVTDTIVFTAEDSGKNGYDIIYKAAEGANPVISGGTKITRWSVHDANKNIYKAPSRGIDTRQLYVNGIRATRARSSGGLSSLSLSSDGMTCSNTEIASYAHPEDLEFVFKGKWLLPRIKAVSAEITGGNCYIEMQQPYFTDSVNDPVTTTRISSPWYYENAYELLDSPGEFYIDPYANMVYYIPRSGEDMATIEAYLPRMEELLRLRGDNMYSPIHNIKFEGLTFANTAWNRPLEVGNCASQNNKGLAGGGVTPTAIYVTGAKDVTITGCRFKNMGGGGLRMEYGFSDINIIGNEFYDISAWAMDIGEYNYNPQDERLENTNVTISNNYIHDVAVEYMGAAAMSIGILSDTEISNNEIYNVPYTAIHIGWGWANVATSNLKNMVVRNNYIHELMTELDDGGAIYMLGGTGASNDNPNWIYENYCKDQHAATCLIYPDEGTGYWLIEQNVLDTRTRTGVPYGMIHTSSIHDITYLNNYTTHGAGRNSGTNCSFSGNYADSSATWNQYAQTIMSRAGLEAEYQYLKD